MKIQALYEMRKALMEEKELSARINEMSNEIQSVIYANIGCMGIRPEPFNKIINVQSCADSIEIRVLEKHKYATASNGTVLHFISSVYNPSILEDIEDFLLLLKREYGQDT